MEDQDIKKIIVEHGFEIYEDEEFKECCNYPKYYISNQGRVFSTYRNIFLKPGIDGKKLPDGSRSGYKFVVLKNKNGKREERYVHRLVAEAYLEYSTETCVHHRDKDHKNNILSNLFWKTHKENSEEGRGINLYVENISTDEKRYFPSITAASEGLEIAYFDIYNALLKSEIVNNYKFEKL